MNSTTYREYLEACNEIAYEAGVLLMRYFKGHFALQHKADKSPVTEADIAANHYIREHLNKLTLDIPVVEEEDSLPAHAAEQFWLVDPLDGTRAFVKGEPEFSVNIGLIKNRRPVLGVIYAPPQERLYYGGIGIGAFRKHGKNPAEKISARTAPEKIVVTRSRSHPSQQTNEYMRRFDVGSVIGVSSAVKFCLVAEGQADLYPRFGRTMEWDTAAGHAILDAAGGRVETADGKPLLYGKHGFENPPFVAFGQ